MSVCSLNDLRSLVSQPTCYKNHDKLTWIYLILMNYFQQNNVFETGLFNFRLMVVTELKMGCDFKNWNLTLWLTIIINTLIMKSFDQTFKIVPPKKTWNALRKIYFFCIFKACVRYFLSNVCFSLNDSPSKTMKNVFYFI